MPTISQIPTKQQLRDWCGYLSVHAAFFNLDMIGIRTKTGETVMITYRGGKKTGYIYEGGNLDHTDVFQIFSDVPENFNNIEMYEQSFSHLVEVLYLQKDLYLWLNENEIVEYKKLKK